MKKLLSFVAGVAVASSVTAFAMSPKIEVNFADKDKFPDWSKDSIERMVDLGIVKGYEDKTFKADKYVTRAELAVMMDRMYENANNESLMSEENVFKLLVNYDGLGSAFTDLESPYRAMIAMANGGLMQTSEPNLGSPEEMSLSLPQGYHIYQHPSTKDYYLLVEGGEDQWYGPFTSKY